MLHGSSYERTVVNELPNNANGADGDKYRSFNLKVVKTGNALDRKQLIRHNTDISYLSTILRFIKEL